jgi:hypothetical protein
MGGWTALFFILNSISRARENRNAAKQIAAAKRQNTENRGIILSKPASVESLVDNYGINGNLIFSGGSERFRNRALARLSHQALYQQQCVVVLHSGNHLLEQEIEAAVGSGFVQKFNKSLPCYDPFYNLSRYEIGSIILESSGKIEPIGRSVIEGMYDFMTSKNTDPSTYLFATCPYHELLSRVKAAEAKQAITDTQAQSIVTKLMQGQQGIPSIANYFFEFYNQSKLILASNPKSAYKANIFSSVANNKIVIFDIISPTNNLLINVVACEIERLLSQGLTVKLIVDGIPYSASPVLQKIIKTIGKLCSVVISDSDVYSIFTGEEPTFFAVCSRADNIYISKHLSVHSCQKWSEIIGSYEKVDIGKTISSSGGLLFPTPMGGGHSVTLSDKKEYIVRPEEIKSLKEDEIYLISKSIEGVMRIGLI